MINEISWHVPYVGSDREAYIILINLCPQFLLSPSYSSFFALTHRLILRLIL